MVRRADIVDGIFVLGWRGWGASVICANHIEDAGQIAMRLNRTTPTQSMEVSDLLGVVICSFGPLFSF